MNSNLPQRLLPRLQDIFFISIFIATLLLGQRMINLDGDFSRHLLTGKYVLETRSFLTVEKFIHPYLNQPYVSHEWLADVVFYAIYSIAGLAGIIALSAFLTASTFTLLYSKASIRLSLRLPVLILVGWGALATSLNWATRPHLISMLLLAIWLVWADDLRRGEKIPLWRFPVFMLAWSNVHGEFIAGILVLLAYSVGWIIDYLLDPAKASLTVGKNIWLAFLLSAIASFINPGGAGPWLSILGFVNNQYLMSRMLEANAPNFQMPELRILFGLLIFSIFLLAVKKEKLSAGQGLLIAGFSAMSLIAFRNIHLYGVTIPFVLAEALGNARNIRIVDRLENILRNIESQLKGIFWPVAATIILSALVITNQTVQKFYQFSPSVFPVQAVEWLEKNPQQGKMFNELNWGGYLDFHLWPGQLTFIDSMADTRGDVTLQYEIVITLQEGWQVIFEKHNIEWAIIENESALAQTLESEYHWRVLYKDDTAIILRK
ncbi:MAG: hypothetical protein HY863_17360 [Chloroflexi bacterium]|nr:hypothetical protein [Chloroflexota bacterium]